jgi:hypothetical protein
MLAHRFVIRVLLFTALFVTGCRSLGFHAAAKPTASVRPVADFEAVTVTGSVAVDITVGGAFAVKVEGDQALARQVETRVAKQMLLVAAQRLDPKGAVRVKVVLPRLVRVQADGARVAVTAGATPDLDVVARGGSTVTVGGVQGGRLAVEGASASRIVVTGTADVLECTLSGASRGDARALIVGSAKVKLAGASRLDLSPKRAVSGEATGASKLAVWGKPRRIGVATRDSASVTVVR